MSYGLIVKSFDAGGNEIIQIDTTQGLTNYVITKMGTGSHVAVGPRTGKHRRVFVRPLRQANGTYDRALEYTGGLVGRYTLCIKAGTQDGPTLQFVIGDTAGPRDGFAWEESWNPVSCDYIIMEDVTGVDPVGDYGLQTLAANGESAFDSRKIKFNNTIGVRRLISTGALGGAGAATDQINNDASQYISVGFSFWDNLGSFAGIDVVADTQNTYYRHQYQNEPTPGDNFNPIYYYENYSVIWIVDKI